MRKAIFWVAFPAAVGAIVATQWKDIHRYFAIKQMDWGQGHPDNVPAGGRIAYPQAEAPSGDMRRG